MGRDCGQVGDGAVAVLEVEGVEGTAPPREEIGERLLMVEQDGILAIA